LDQFARLFNRFIELFEICKQEDGIVQKDSHSEPFGNSRNARSDVPNPQDSYGLTQAGHPSACCMSSSHGSSLF
jgi:hypothetical protein